MYSQTYNIRRYDADKNGFAKPAGLLQEMQDAGDRQMLAEGPSYDEILERGQALMLNRLDMNILTEIRLNDFLLVKSWPCFIEKASFMRCYGMWRGDEKVAEISSQWSLVDIAERKILRSTDIDFSHYTFAPYEEAAPGKFRIPKEIGKTMELVDSHRVGYSDADGNGHMNNTYYLDVLCNQIPELEAGTHRVDSVRMHYSKEAVLGDTIAVYRSEKMEGREGSSQESRYLLRTVLSDGEMNIEAEIGLTGVK